MKSSNHMRPGTCFELPIFIIYYPDIVFLRYD